MSLRTGRYLAEPTERYDAMDDRRAKALANVERNWRKTMAESTVFCPSCGSSNESANTLCAACGRALPLRAAAPEPFSTYPEPFSDRAGDAPAPAEPAPTAPLSAPSPSLPPLWQPEPVDAPAFSQQPLFEAPAEVTDLPVQPAGITEIPADIAPPVADITPPPADTAPPVAPPPLLGLSGDLRSEILALLRRGVKGSAIQRVREKTGIGLADAKRYVDNLEEAEGISASAGSSSLDSPGTFIVPPPQQSGTLCTVCGGVVPAQYETCPRCGVSTASAEPQVRFATAPSPESVMGGLNLSPQAFSTIYGLTRRNLRIQAISVLRQNTGMGLREAKDVIDRLAEAIGVAPTQQVQCYIATACYGDGNHPDVEALRAFRDRVLMPTPWGRALVSAYYAVSPGFARRLGHGTPAARLVRRGILEPLVRRLRP